MICYKSKALLMAATLLTSAISCKDEDTKVEPIKLYTYTTTASWNCSGSNCQDVWELELNAGTTASFSIVEISAGSVAQMALYKPGEDLGGINLLTGEENEYSCIEFTSCDLSTSVAVETVNITETGKYKFASTRNNSKSCGNTGTYRVVIISNENNPQLIEDNAASLAPNAASCTLKN